MDGNGKKKKSLGDVQCIKSFSSFIKFSLNVLYVWDYNLTFLQGQINLSEPNRDHKPVLTFIVRKIRVFTGEIKICHIWLEYKILQVLRISLKE